jgi:serine/threonine-protein phosphatase 6 regulatory ankyrin repeat subunit B
MSFPNPSSKVSSTPRIPGAHTPPPAAAGDQRAPGLTESPDDSRGAALLESASRDGDLSLDECISAIARLSEALEARNRATLPDLGQDIAVFADLKKFQAEIETALWLDRDAPALWDLRAALRPFLLRLATDFAKPDKRDKTAEDLMHSLDQDVVRTLCNGLAVCASSWAGLLFGESDLETLRPALQLLTDRLLERVIEIGFPEEVGANGTTLDILNWVSRALKNDMVKAGKEIRDAFTLALPLLKDWIGVDRDDAASAAKVPYLSAYQLGKCAVQIDTMLKFSLIELDRGNRQQIADCIGALCKPRIRAHLTKRPVDSVTITSIGNLAKDLLEAGILSVDQAPQLATLAGAAQMMGCIPRTDLLAGDCRTLSNVGNFLRMLDEHEVPRLHGFTNHLRQWHAACDALVDCLASKGFGTAQPSAQAVSNLISFVKCRCKQLQKERDGTAVDKITPLRSAAACLAQKLVDHGGAAFHTIEAIGGLLSGVAYLLEAGLLPDTTALRAVLAQVMTKLGRVRNRIENAQARRTLLAALSGLLRMGAIALEEAQPVLSRLLGPAASSSGWSLQELQRESVALGMEGEAVPVVPPEPVAASSTLTATTTSTASTTSTPAQAAAPRPGYTRIIEAPRAEMFASASTTKTVTTSASSRTVGDWQPPQKTIKPGRQTILSSAPVLVAEALSAVHSASITTTTTNASTTTTRNSSTTTSTATQPVVPMAAASDAAALPAGKAGKHQAASRGKPKSGKAGASNANGKAATPKQQWFALLKGAGALLELKRLAAVPAVLNAREGEDKRQRGALFHALVHGRKDVVEWLLQPQAGYALEDEAGALLNAVCEAIDLVEDAQLQAIACFIDSLDEAAREEVKTLFSGHMAPSAGVQRLLKDRGLASAEPAQADAAASAGGKGKPGKRERERMQQKLLDAAIQGNVDEVRQQLRAKAPVDQANGKGFTALMAASQKGHLAVVQELLKANATVDQASGEGFTALMLASHNGHLSIVQELLKANATVDHKSENGFTALMIASEEGHLATVKELLKAKANVDQANNAGETALTMTSDKGYLDIVQELLSAKAQVDKATGEGLTALMLASLAGHPAIVQKLLSAAAQVDHANREGGTALMLASKIGHIAIVRELLKANATVDQKSKNGFTALMVASQNGRLAIVQELLRVNAPVDQASGEGFTALMLASQNGHLAIVQELLRVNATVDQANKYGFTALMVASHAGHPAIVQKLLSAAAQVDQATREGFTALMLASAQGHLAVVQALVEARASVHLVDEQERTALTHALFSDQADIVEFLLQPGAS